jgi:hypothetical protein
MQRLGEKYYEKFMTETEAQIQKAIMQWGQYKKVLMHRINVIGTPLHKDGLTVYRPSTNKGMADIHATVLVGNIPVSVWLEVKSAKGKMSSSQIAFRDTVMKHRGYYYEVRSIEDVEDALREVEILTWENINIATERENAKHRSRSY